MNLINRIYKNNKIESMNRNSRPDFIFDNDGMEILSKFVRYTRFFDTDLEVSDILYNVGEVFSRLGIECNGRVYLGDIQLGASRYNIDREGKCSFRYLYDGLEYDDNNMVEYYSSNELFYGNNDYVKYPAIKFSSGNTSLYYTAGSVPLLRKYEIKLADGSILTREYSGNEVLFMLEKDNNSFVIRVNKPTFKVSYGDYVLDNELEFVNYLMSLSTLDIVSVYKELCELSLGNDISIYPEITLSEIVANERGMVKDKNLLTIVNGKLDCAVRTVGDKTITVYGNGNWNYSMDDENVNFRINSGKTLKYAIEGKDDKMIDSYINTLLSYDIGKAKEEIETTKKMIKGLGISVKNRR